MPACNITKRIPSNECIGDSLRTINTNFSALDVNFCSIPYFVGGQNITVDRKLDALKRPYAELKSQNQPTYFREFNSISSNVSLSTIPLTDGTSTAAYVFPYDNSLVNQKPIGTFETISNGSGSPELTLYWFAPSENLTTIYALNSSVSVTQPGLVTPNKEVKCMYRDGDSVYIGGRFTTIGETPQVNFAVLNLETGSAAPSLGYTSTLAGNPLSSYFESSTQGEVNFITTFTKDAMKFLVVAGSFNNESLGRGVFIYNMDTQSLYPFYCNGLVNDGFVYEDHLYLVGQFDYINYGSQPGNVISGQRVYSNNICKISLHQTTFSVNSIDRTFAENAMQAFQNSTELTSIVRHRTQFFIGGLLEKYNSAGELIHKNLVALNFDGTSVAEWKFIANGSVKTLCVDSSNDYLYLGGEFTNFASYDDLYSAIPLEQNRNNFNFAASLDLSNIGSPGINYEWKPKFNGPISKLAIQDPLYDTPLYAIGAFTQLNEISVSHIAAVTKPTNTVGNNSVGVAILWDVFLDQKPSPSSNAILVMDNQSMLIGGNFNLINQQRRHFLAKIANPVVTQSIVQRKLSLDFGGQIVSTNHPFLFDYDNVTTTSATTPSGPWLTINKTIFPTLTKGFEFLEKNQLCRFFIRRPGRFTQIGNLEPTDDYLQVPLYIVGWSLDFKPNK